MIPGFSDDLRLLSGISRVIVQNDHWNQLNIWELKKEVNKARERRPHF